MRNFKKILSLVLAMAMMLSVMVVGAGAAFKDEGDFSEEYVTAAEALTNLGVLKGYEDGTFQPKDTITRAETAALIYRMATGDVDDAKTGIYTQMTNGFTDVPNGQWFAGYVNFCANSQYILGMGDGTFGPQKNVTGYQTLAMILRAAGFDKDGEFAGPDWEVKTASFAEKLGVLENVKGSEDLGAPASRELVAELLFAVMSEVELVHYAPFWGYVKQGETLGEMQFDLVEVEGVVVANEMAALESQSVKDKVMDAGETLIQFANGKTNDYALSTDLDIIGEQVAFWAAGEDVAVSTPVSQADTTTEWSNTTYDYLDKDAKEDFAEAVDGHEFFYNYDAVEAISLGLGVYVKVIDNDKAYDDYVLVEKMSLSTVKGIDKDGDVKLDGVKEIKADDVAYEGIAAGDVVLYIAIDGTTYIEEASCVTGNVTKVNHYAKADDTATIGGEAYAESVIAPTKGADVHDFNLTKGSESTYGHEYNDKAYNYYQDAFGNIIAWAFASENEFGYALILRYDMVDVNAPFAQDELWVEYLTADGSVEQAVIDTDEGAFFATPDQKAAGKVVNYRIDADGEFVVVYPCDDVTNTTMTVDAEDQLATTSKTEWVGNPWGGYKKTTTATYDACEVVAFYYYKNAAGDINYGVKTGADALADLDGRTVGLTQIDKKDATTVDGIGEVMMVNVSDIYAPATQYAYITSSDYDHELFNGESVYTYSALNEIGEEIVITTDKAEWLFEGSVVEYFEYDLNVVGQDEVEEINFVKGLWNVEEGFLLAYGPHDLGKFQLINMFSTKTLEQPDVFVDVENGGTFSYADFTRDDAAWGKVVVSGSEALAVFVTEAPDGQTWFD